MISVILYYIVYGCVICNKIINNSFDIIEYILYKTNDELDYQLE